MSGQNFNLTSSTTLAKVESAPVHSQSKPVQEPEFESDSSESETEELFYPRYMLPLKRKQSSNINVGRQFVAGYGFGSPGISTTDVVIGLFYICK